MDSLTYFRLFHNITQAEYELLMHDCKTKTYKKGDYIILTGQVQRELLFVEAGVQMSYFETEGKTHVIAFTYPPNPCAIPDSFPLQKPSRYFLKCLTDSECKTLHYEKLQQVFEQSQGIERLFRKMTEAILAGIINRHTELHSLTMEERYKAFCQRSPHLLQLVPHKYIASYLGIDPTNFSKLFNTVRF